MTISLRLDDDLARRLQTAASARGISKSELVRQCVIQFLGNEQQSTTAWEAGRHLFGRHGSGRGDLSERCEEILRDTFRAKAGCH